MNKSEQLLNLCESIASDSDISVFSKTNKPRNLTQYAYNDTSNRATTKTQEALGAGIYKITNTMAGIEFKKHFLDTDELLRFEDKRYNEILSEIKKFWTLRENYRKMGFTHKRGLVVYGTPGCGKSCLLKLVMEDVVKQGDVVFISSPDDPSLLTEGLRIFKEVEPDRNALVILEDIDGGIGGYTERKWLDLLDGDTQIDGALFLATSNYISNFPPRFLRPGRFDRKLEIKNPPKQGRLAYLKKKLGVNEKQELLEELADITDGFSFAQLREFLVGTYCLGGKKEDVVNRIKKGLEESFVKDKNISKDGKSVFFNGAWFPLKKGETPEKAIKRLKDAMETQPRKSMESFQNGTKDKKFLAVNTDEDGIPLSAQIITLFNEVRKCN